MRLTSTRPGDSPLGKDGVRHHVIDQFLVSTESGPVFWRAEHVIAFWIDELAALDALL